MFQESYFEAERDSIFRDVAVLIYVFDVRSPEQEKDMKDYSRCVEAIRRHGSKAKVFCLVHKMDKIPPESKVIAFQGKREAILDRSKGFETECFATSIWDETLYKVREQRATPARAIRIVRACVRVEHGVRCAGLNLCAGVVCNCGRAGSQHRAPWLGAQPASRRLRCERGCAFRECHLPRGVIVHTALSCGRAPFREDVQHRQAAQALLHVRKNAPARPADRKQPFQGLPHPPHPNHHRHDCHTAPWSL